MPNVAQVLKLEMKRIAAKEVRVSGLAGKLKAVNAKVRALSRKLKELEKRPVVVAARPEAQKAEAPKKGRRFVATPAVVKRVRAKLGVTQMELAKLMGVSHSAVYQWEAGRIAPRARVAAQMQALEKIGRREAQRRLEAAAKGRKRKKR
jgi:DNA-binding transcriptional regulator YiaG